MIIDEEERKKRLERARQISNSINARKNTVNNSNMYTNQEYINRFNRAREISNSINPRKNNTIRTVSQEELAKSEENGKFFMDLIDKNVNSDDSEKTNPVQETGISNKPIENKNEVNVNKLTPEQQKELQNKVKEASNVQAPNSKKTEISIINNAKEKKNWFQANELEDGYQFGDISKTILGTGTDIVQDLATGILSPIENVLDIGTNAVATVQNILGFKDAAKKTRNFADKNITQNVTSKVANASTVGMLYNLVNGTPEKVINPAGITYDKDKNIVENYASGLNQFINETGEKQGYENSSVLGTNTDQVVELFGYTLGLSGIGGSLSAKTGTKTIGSSKLGANLSGGNIGLRLGGKTLNLPTLAIAGGMAGGLQEANSKPNVSEVERWTKAFISGGVEGTTEGIFGVLGVGGNEITDEFGKKLVSKFTSKAAKTLANLGVKMTGEAAEEFLSYTGNFFADNRIIDKLGEADFHYDWNWADVFEQMTLAALSAGLGSSTAMIINSNSATKSAEEQLGRELTQEEKKIVTKAVVDDSLNKQIEQMYQNEDIPQKLYVSTFNPDGTIANVEETRGKSINNPNKKVNVQPAIVKTGNDIYTVIDTETGLRLDTTPYNSMLAAEAGFNSKMINLKERDITAINKKVAMSDYSVRDALLNTAYTIQNDIMQRRNTAQTFQNNNTDVQNSETTNYLSQNENAVKTQNNVSQINNARNIERNSSKNTIQKNAVEISSNIYENVSKRKQTSTLNEYLKNNIRGKDFYVDNEKIIASNTTIGKLRYGETNFDKKIAPSLRQELKANVISNLQDVISNSVLYQTNLKDTKNHNFADTFDRRKSIISYKGQNYEVMFEVGKKDGRNTLYGIENIKRTQKNRLSYPNLVAKSDLNDVKNVGSTKSKISIPQNSSGVNEVNSTKIKVDTPLATTKKSMPIQGKSTSINTSISQKNNSVKANVNNKSIQNTENYTNENLKKSVEIFKNAKDNVDRDTIINIVRSLDIYHRGNTFIDNNMKNKSGQNSNSKIIKIDNYFTEYIDKEDLRLQAYKYAMNTYKNRIVKIKDIRDNVDIPQSGIKKTFGKNQDNIKMQTANNLSDIIEESLYFNSSKSTKNSNIIYHYFYAPVSVNNNNEIAMITIKEDISNKEENNKFYYHDIRNIDELDKIIKNGKAHAMPHNNVSNMLFEQSHSSINTSISQKQNSVKTNVNNNKSMQKIQTLYRKFSKDFHENGYGDLNGRKVSNVQEVADIAQVFRNPNYETFRILYTKGDTIVGQEAVSSRIPGQTNIFKDNNRIKGFYNVKERMSRLNADGYYMIHNHPSGNAVASQVDINTTQKFYNNVPGFKAHIIVNSGTYAVIEREKGELSRLTTKNEITIENYKQDDIDKMMSSNPWSDIKIKSNQDIAKLMHDVKNNPNYSTLIMVDDKLFPRIILDIPNNFFSMKRSQIDGYIKNIAKQNGATRAFIATTNNDVYNSTNKLLTITDSILYSVNGNDIIQEDTLSKNDEYITKQKIFSNSDLRVKKVSTEALDAKAKRNIAIKEEQEKIKKELHNRIQNAILSRNSRKNTYLGNVSNAVVKKVKSLFGIDVSGRKHIISDNDIRHIIKQHGNPEIEKARGQIAVTSKDIEKIPDIIENYDSIEKGNINTDSFTKQDSNTIRYKKQYSNNITFVVEVIPSSSNQLTIKTMWKKKLDTNKKNNSSRVNHANNNIDPQNTPRAEPTSSYSSNSISQNTSNVKDNGVRAESILTKSKVIYDEETNSLKYNNQPLYFRFDTQDGFKGKEHKSGVSMWEDKVDDYIYDERNEKDLKTIYGIDDILELDDDKLEKLKREIAEDNGWITNGASVFNFTDDGIDFFREYDRTHYVTDYEKVHIFTGTETEYGADLEDVVIPDVIVSEMNTVDFMNIVESTLEQNENKNIETINKKILQNIARNINSNNQTANRYEKPTLYDERKHSNDKNFINNIKDNNYLKTLLSVDNSKGATNAQSSERLIEQEIELVEFMGAFDNNIPVTKLTDIRKTIENYLGKKLLKGHFREPAYGIYKSKNDFIRVKELKDIDNILHEVGHALDLGQRITINKGELQNELLEAVQRHGGYENDTKTVQLEEGWAEVVRVYIINQSLAEKLYPKTASFIDNVRQQDKSINDFLTRVQNQLYNYIHQNPRNRILSNMSIGEQTDKEPMTPEKFKKNVMRLIYDKDYLLKTTVNDWAKMSGKRPSEIDPSRNAYILTRLASGVNNKAVSMISDGYIDVNGDKLMPGLNKLGEILNNDPQRFNDLRAYLVAKRDLEYKAKSLKTGIRTLDSKAVVKQFENDIQIQEAAQIVYDTLNGVLQYAVNNGLITQENADTIKESNTFYIPFQRVVGKNQVGRRGAVSEIIKGRTGSELDIKDVLENIVVNSANIIQQVENNNVLRALYEQGEELGMQNAIFDVIPTPVQHVGTATLSTWESELKKQGVDIENIDLEKTIDIFAPNNKIDQENRITSFIGTNGNRVYLQFTEQDIFNSIMALDKNSNSWFLKLMGKLNMPLRYGATMANIGFAIPNMIADTAQAAIYSEAGFIPVIDNVIGILDILAAQNKTVRNFVNKYAPEYAKKIEYLYNIYQQSGASSSTRLSQYRKSSQEIMKDIYGTKNSETLGIKESFKPLKRLLDIMTYIPELSEQSTRFRVFERNYEAYKNKGGSEIDARTKAAIESRDATQDFGRTGTAMREINQLIPFSAARVGSVYTFSEKVTQNTKKTMTRIALLSVLAMLIKAIGYDDKEIEELNQRKKNDNFVLNIGGTIVTIKKPQGVLRSILSLEEYVLDLATGHIEEGKEGEMLGKWLETALMDNLPADEIGGLVPNAIAPIIENAYNKDFYYNSDIVKSYDLDLPESQQYYDYTSQLAIFLGKIFNYSPAKIDNLISGYFGGLGTQVTNIIDNISGKLGLSVEKPVMGAEDNAIGKRFVVNVNENSASIDEIYTLKNELTKKLNGGTITSEENKQLETLKQATSDMAALNKQIKAIKKDLTMSGTEKADKIRPLQEQKTDVARKALGKDPIFTTRTSDLDSLQFYPSRDILSKNSYTLSLTEEMKKEYEKLAYSQYQKYKKQGIYSEEYLDKLKSKCKDYAKSKMMQKYKNKLTKSK